ncbi:hypothetical protein AB4K20DRAFT_1984290 [Rhizopus microsporus]
MHLCLSNCISSFDKAFSTPLDLYYQANNGVFHPFEEKYEKWVQQTTRSAADIYLYNTLGSANSLEARARRNMDNKMDMMFSAALVNMSALRTEYSKHSSSFLDIISILEITLEGEGCDRGNNRNCKQLPKETIRLSVFFTSTFNRFMLQQSEL